MSKFGFAVMSKRILIGAQGKDKQLLCKERTLLQAERLMNYAHLLLVLH